jgi:hypothetical protein
VIGVKCPKGTRMRMGSLPAVADPVLVGVPSWDLVPAQEPSSTEAEPLPEGVDLAALASGKGPAAVSVEGDRVIVRAPLAWKERAQDGRTWRVFPVPFQTGLAVSDVTLDGRPCPLDAPSDPAACRLLNGALAVPLDPTGPTPSEVAFRVPPEAAAGEARIRGLATAPHGAAYRVDGLDRPVVFAHNVGASVALDTVPAGAAVSFRPVVLDSPVFGGGNGLTFEVQVRARQGARTAARTAWSQAVRGDTTGRVRVPIEPGDGLGGAVITLRVPGTSEYRLGPIPVWADLRLVGETPSAEP